MTNVPPGPGWWLASDGRWYPPEALARQRPLEPSPLSPVITRGPVGGTRDLQWRTAIRRPVDTVIRDRRSVGDPVRQIFDPRGVFVAAASLLLLGACALPYYHVVSAGDSGLRASHDYTVVRNAFGSWRVALPAVGALAIVVGVVNSMLRAGATGAVSVFVALRLAALAQFGLWIVVALDRQVVVAQVASPATSSPPPVPAGGTTPTIGVTWLAWIAIGIAFTALAGSFAAMRKPDST